MFSGSLDASDWSMPTNPSCTSGVGRLWRHLIIGVQYLYFSKSFVHAPGWITSGSYAIGIHTCTRLGYIWALCPYGELFLFAPDLCYVWVLYPCHGKLYICAPDCFIWVLVPLSLQTVHLCTRLFHLGSYTLVIHSKLHTCTKLLHLGTYMPLS